MEEPLHLRVRLVATARRVMPAMVRMFSGLWGWEERRRMLEVMAGWVEVSESLLERGGRARELAMVVMVVTSICLLAMAG
jgi:hypothetical protein